MKKVSLIGAPTDIGAGSRGASMGPEALRVAGIAPVLARHGLEVLDLGNLAGPANPWLPPVNGYRHLAQVVEWNQTVHDAVHAELRRGRLPVLLGGDHCLGVGSISAVARHCREANKKLRVLWLDAHADFNTNVLTPSGNTHGMPVACLCGQGPQELIEIGGAVPALNPKVIRQIGIRSVDDGEKRLVHEADLDVFDMRFIDVEAHMQMRVGVHGGQRQFHGVAHAHLVDVAHVEDLQPRLVHEALLARVDAADADLAHPLGADGGHVAADLDQRLRAAAAQAGQACRAGCRWG